MSGHGGSAVGAGCFCRSSIKVRAPCAVSVPARLQEGAGDERGPSPESRRSRTHERADRALGHAGLRPARRRPWRIWRRHFKGLTGDDQMRCAGCGRRRDAVVAEALWAFVGLTPGQGPKGLCAVRSPRMELLFLSGWIWGRTALQKHRVSGSGRASRGQFRFGPLKCVSVPKRAMNSGMAEPTARFSRRSSSREGIRSRPISDMEDPHRLSDERSSQSIGTGCRRS